MTTAAPDTLQVHQGKQLVTRDIGHQVHERLNNARNRKQQFIGAAGAFLSGIKSIESMRQHLKDDFENDKSDLHKAVGEPTLIRAYVNKYLDRCVNALDNLEMQAKANELAAHGAVQDLEEVVKTVQRYHDVSTSRVLEISSAEKEAKEAAANGESPRRPGDGSVRAELEARVSGGARAKTKKPRKKATKKRRR